MPPRTRAALFDIQHAVLGIAEFLIDKTYEDFQDDLMLKSAVHYQFSVIGEATRRLRNHDPETAQRISEYERIIDFRNVVVHGYDHISDVITWKIIQEKLPILQREVEGLLRDVT